MQLATNLAGDWMSVHGLANGLIFTKDRQLGRCLAHTECVKLPFQNTSPAGKFRIMIVTLNY